LAKKTESRGYTKEDIKVLEGLEAVRRRPAMYIGSTGPRGLHHMIYEVVDNSIDEALAESCDKIEIIIHKDNSVTIADNGDGIPTGPHPTEKKDTIDVVMTTLHSGAKFDDKTYQVSGGLHGVGVSVVNALSEWLKVEIKREGYKWNREYAYGKPVGKIKKSGNGKIKTTGTSITFLPDKQIFDNIRFSHGTLENRFRELAYLMGGVKIIFVDERLKSEKKRKQIFKFKGGIIEFIKFLSEGKDLFHKTPIFIEKKMNGVEIELSLLYTGAYSESIHTYVNNIPTIEGGTHLSGFKTALTRIINEYAQKNGLKKDDITYSGEDVREGVTAILSVRMPEPQFEGQTKTKLGNNDIHGLVYSMVYDGLGDYFEKNPDILKKIAKKIEQAYRAREAARKARDLTRRKSALESSALPGILADCSSRDVESTEIFIVEGPSAGGSAKQGRDRRTQAILPLKGKILNVEKARLNRILSNEEIKTIIIALGTGIGTEEFNPEKLRYNKIILMTDADIDGAHIRTLLLTFFYRYMKELIEMGKIYIAQPPLYRVYHGKKERYVYSEAELKKVLKDFGKGKYSIQRYKGLGEMNPEQLWKTTMDPNNRILLKVTIEDAAEADRIFSMLMGTKVAPRKEFIEEHADEVVNLDV
jgi:DNA gyrase subunit B